jgi:hypothetical protein
MPTILNRLRAYKSFAQRRRSRARAAAGSAGAKNTEKEAIEISMAEVTAIPRGRSRMRFPHCFGITALGIFLAGSPAGATEYSLAHYPTGTNTIVPALMPQPGASV